MALELDFTNRTVLVIGGTSGINRGVAEEFARHGARVAVASRSQAKVDDTVATLKGLGAEAMGFTADVRDMESLGAGVAEVHEAFGDFDAVISGAAGNFPSLAEDLTPKGFKSVVDIDLVGTFHAMKAVFPYLKRPGASVINISAPQSYIPMKAQIHVAAAKAGVDMITRTLALEWGQLGIRVNSVVPGPIDGTEGMRRLAPTEEIKQRSADGVPLKRLGLPQDIGYACLFLASEFATYISGVVLPVDGGWTQNSCGAMSDYLGDLAARLARDRHQ